MSMPESFGVQFKLIDGFSGYAVGDDGSVWSNFQCRRFKPGWRRVSLHRRGYGSRYVVVCLRDDSGRGKVICRYVHRLVLEAFVGPSNGLEACHYDGDTSNNRLANLRWDTHAGNMADKIRHGTNVRKLKPQCVRGHDLSGASIKINKHGHRSRVCISCRKLQRRMRLETMNASGAA